MKENPYEPPKLPSDNQPESRVLGDIVAWTVAAIFIALLIAFAWSTRFK